MYWTLELASKLEDAPWPAAKQIIFCLATGRKVFMQKSSNLVLVLVEEEVVFGGVVGPS